MRTPISKFLGQKVGNFVDFFHFPFRKFCTKQFFRYGVCGVANVVLGLLLFAFLYNFVFKKQVVDLGFIAFTPYIAAFLVQFPITFITGFWLGRYVSFSESNIRGRSQIMRYLLVVICCLTINYWGLKLFVEICGLFPTPSQLLISLITAVFSYFSQKYFSFKLSNEK
ncbi:MAG: GtrA family protein [Prevotellaceae bacterium]|jgi:putative flippase GtrA|nr:GtrA family protein [Prevotellaceae bacterium]